MTITRSRQEFEASVIQRYTERSSRLLWFSTDPKAETSQACLFINAVRMSVHAVNEWNFDIELNGQENFQAGREIERIDASAERLKVRFRRGHGIYPGDVGESQSRKVLELVVRFHLAPRNAMYRS
jgi:hypothetical protein